VPGRRVRHQRGDHEGAHAARALLEQHRMLLKKRLDPTDPGGEDDAAPLG
jgi:hypothetical protein